MAKNLIKIGTRGSDLALWQADLVKTKLKSFYPELEVEIIIIQTTGDKILDTALSKIGDKGLFTKQIEDSLLDNSTDIAVHSLKDLPTRLPYGLMIGAVLERELPNDVLVSDKYHSIDELPEHAIVATGSLRRQSQILNFRPDLTIADIRGNVPTRIAKYSQLGADALILAYAGLHRLGFDSEIKQKIAYEIMLPAVGQGAVAVEIRAGDAETANIVSALNDNETEICTLAERAFLNTLEGGCQIPVGAIAEITDNKLFLRGIVGSLDGKKVLKGEISGAIKDAKNIGRELAGILITQGADEILSNARNIADAGR